jgi:hypothetical protein
MGRRIAGMARWNFYRICEAPKAALAARDFGGAPTSQADLKQKHRIADVI